MPSSARLLAGRVATAASSLRFILSVLRVVPPVGIASGPAVVAALGSPPRRLRTMGGGGSAPRPYVWLHTWVGADRHKQCIPDPGGFNRTWSAGAGGRQKPRSRDSRYFRTSRLRILPPTPVPRISPRLRSCSS